jgi:hypothetical protein
MVFEVTDWTGAVPLFAFVLAVLLGAFDAGAALAEEEGEASAPAVASTLVGSLTAWSCFSWD